MNNILDNEELNIKIRKFLKQVGVGTHQLIEEFLRKESLKCNVSITVEINEKEVKKFDISLKN